MKYLSFLLLSYLAISLNAYADSVKSSDIKVHQEILMQYKPEKISEHVYVIHGPDRVTLKESQGFVNNPAFIITEKSVVVIDPGTSVQIGRAVLAHIRKLTQKPITDIFITHVHGDHWLGNHAFQEENPDIRIYAHPQMIDDAMEGEAESWLEIFTNITEGAIKGTEVVIPTIALKDQQQLKIDNITIKAHLSKWAHTKTDVMFEVIEDKVLFTGDTVNNQRVVPFNEGSFRGSIDVIESAMKLNAAFVVPGHGQSTEVHLLKDYKEALEVIYKKVASLMEEDLETFEMKQEILKLNTVFKDWSGFEDEIGRYISLAVLEAEQEDF